MYHEEWVNVRERLGFKPPADPDRRPSREKTINEGFSWVPPGLPSHKVSVNINWPYDTHRNVNRLFCLLELSQ